MQHANSDGRIGIKQTCGQETVLAIVDHGEFAGEPVPILFAHAAGKHPWVSHPQLSFCCRRDAKPQSRGLSGGLVHVKNNATMAIWCVRTSLRSLFLKMGRRGSDCLKTSAGFSGVRP